MQPQSSARKPRPPCSDPPCRPGKRCVFHYNVDRLRRVKSTLNDALKLARDLDERWSPTEEDRLLALDTLDQVQEACDALQVALRP